MRADFQQDPGPNGAAVSAPPARAPRSAVRAGVMGVTALALVLAAFSWFTRPKGADHAKAGSAGAPVRVGVATRRDMAVVERSVGSVMAQTFVQVLPQVTGKLERQDFHEGQFVRRGELLFEIDPRPYAAAAAQARGVYDKDLAQLKNAQADLQRFESLYQQNSTSKQSRDTAAANAEVMAATAASDKAALEAALLNLDYTKIRSPIDGKTGPVLVQPGNIANASSSTALVTIAQVRPVKVSFTLPQSDLPRIQARQRTGKLLARLEVPGAGGGAYTAPVDFVANSVNAQSGTIELRATFRNEDLALVPGQLVQVVVELGDLSDAIVVPRDAVNDSPTGPYVYAVERNKAVMKSVSVLFDDGADDAVSGDLHPGDVVITEGQLRVDEGGKVHVLGPSTPAPKLASDRIHPAR
jgi:multidrug efflux system membrane fusion protein